MKHSSFSLANEAWEENQPVDRAWLRNILNKQCKNEKERREWARGVVECFAAKEDTPQLIARAATLLLDWAKREIR